MHPDDTFSHSYLSEKGGLSATTVAVRLVQLGEDPIAECAPERVVVGR
jgi:hypothetical protein